jgi:hypothetical protein
MKAITISILFLVVSFLYSCNYAGQKEKYTIVITCTGNVHYYGSIIESSDEKSNPTSIEGYTSKKITTLPCNGVTAYINKTEGEGEIKLEIYDNENRLKKYTLINSSNPKDGISYLKN